MYPRYRDVMPYADSLLVRAAVVRIVDHGDSTTVIGPQHARRYAGDSAELLRAVLELHGRPLTRSELFAELAVRTGGEVRQRRSMICSRCSSRTACSSRRAHPHPRRSSRPGGSSSRSRARSPRSMRAALIRGLHAAGCEVRVALSRTARRFISVEALEALTHHAVWKSMWQRTARVPVPHINLAEWAELVLVSPASATSIARIAIGDCSDLVAALVCATRAPVMIVPSMNDAMYDSPAVQANLATLRAHGRWLVHPRSASRSPIVPATAAPCSVLHLPRAP